MLPPVHLLSVLMRGSSSHMLRGSSLVMVLRGASHIIVLILILIVTSHFVLTPPHFVRVPSIIVLPPIMSSPPIVSHIMLSFVSLIILSVMLSMVPHSIPSHIVGGSLVPVLVGGGSVVSLVLLRGSSLVSW